MTTTHRTTPKMIDTSTFLSLVIYLALMAYLLLVKVILELRLVEVAVPAQASLFAWPLIGFLAVAGGFAVRLGPRTGLPDVWDPNISTRRWLLLPAVVGAGLGVVILVGLGFTGYSQIMAEAANVPSINVPFPGSIVVYSGGSIVVEALYRLILITLPLWLIVGVILRGRGQAPVFWALALLTSLLESVGLASLASGHPGVMLVAGVGMFGIDFVEAYLFRRYGLLAPLVHRLAFYFVWHIVGGLIGF